MCKLKTRNSTVKISRGNAIALGRKSKSSSVSCLYRTVAICVAQDQIFIFVYLTSWERSSWLVNEWTATTCPLVSCLSRRYDWWWCRPGSCLTTKQSVLCTTTVGVIDIPAYYGLRRRCSWPPFGHRHIHSQISLFIFAGRSPSQSDAVF